MMLIETLLWKFGGRKSGKALFMKACKISPKGILMRHSTNTSHTSHSGQILNFIGHRPVMKKRGE